MLKLLLIDDEVDALEVLEWKLKKYVSNIEVTMCSSAIKALKICEDLKPDIVFLDIQMPEMNGFSFLENLTSKNFKLIFTTAFDEFALKAIKENAIDYLLKPIDKAELIHAVEKARLSIENDDLGAKVHSLLNTIHNPPCKINISADGKIYIIEPHDVIMLQADKSYTTIFLKSNQKIVVSKTLKEVEKKFMMHSFYRVHNSYLINLDHVKAYLKRMGGELVLTNELTASVSRNKKIELMNKLQLTN